MANAAARLGPQQRIQRAPTATGSKGGGGGWTRRTWESTVRVFCGGKAIEKAGEVLKTAKEVFKTPTSSNRLYVLKS